MSISRKTYAAFGRAITAAYDHGELDALFFEYSFKDPNPGESRIKKSIRFSEYLENLGKSSGHKEILEIAETTLKRAVQRHTELRNLLEIDGYQFENNRLIPTTPEPAALAKQISILESQLADKGFVTAATHYEQAVENFTNSNWESSNAQLRSFVENLIPSIEEFVAGSRSNNPNAALQSMKNSGVLDEAEFNQFRAFWAGIQDNGPHQGLSSDSEALFRIHMCTCIARYLLEKCAT